MIAAIYLDKNKSKKLFEKQNLQEFYIRVYLTRNLNFGDIVYLCVNKDNIHADIMKCKIISMEHFYRNKNYPRFDYETKNGGRF